MNNKKLTDFIWQHLLLLISLFLLALGVALCIRSQLGSSVISSAPYAFTLAGRAGYVFPWTLGMYTNILNILLVIGQIIVLGRNFKTIQLLQLVIGIVFGVLIDFSMSLTSIVECDAIFPRLILMIVGSTVMSLGVTMEIRCGSITMPGEGLPAAIALKTGKDFSMIKILVDISLVMIAAISAYVFFHTWLWNVVGVGTLFAMVYCGMAVKFFSRHISWFDRLLGYHPGFRSFFFGLAGFLRNSRK